MSNTFTRPLSAGQVLVALAAMAVGFIAMTGTERGEPPLPKASTDRAADAARFYREADAAVIQRCKLAGLSHDHPACRQARDELRRIATGGY